MKWKSIFKKQAVLLLIIGAVVFSPGASASASSGQNAPGNPSVAAPVKVTGKVTDASGASLPGVTVLVKGTTTGTVTDNDGKFALDAPDTKSKLVFSFVGFTTVEQSAGQKVINVMLSEDIKKLDDVIVIGYGTTKKEDLSASVSVIQNMDQLKESPTFNLESMIQGRIPGVTITNNGGDPTAGPSVTIRGTGSATEAVLYVVDGVPGAPFNPQDVESITVLKDAASAAIYGASAGSAGVILITTRQAKAGKTSIDYSGFYGVKNAWRVPESLTAAQQGQVSNQAWANAGQQGLAAWDPAQNPSGQITRTDWIKSIFRTATVQRHTVTLSGGTDKLSSLFQVRTEDEEGTLLNTYNKNVSARYNAIYTVNKYLKFKESIFWNNSEGRGTSTNNGYDGTIISAIYMPRNATIYNPDGTFGGTGDPSSIYLGAYGDIVNPVASLLRNQGFSRNSDIMATSEMGISNIVKGLEFTSRFSYRLGTNYNKFFSPRRPEPGKPYDQNSLSENAGYNRNWLLENTLNYTRTFDRHNISAMISTTARDDLGMGMSASALGFSSEAIWAQFFGQATIFDQSHPGDYKWEDKNVSYIGRIAYSYADRYFVTGSYRNDIAGRLAPGNRSKLFPGVTGAWKISSEPWFKSSLINLLKVRASWGEIGNLSSIGLGYGYPVLSQGGANQVGINGPLGSTAYIGNAYNPNLSWETSRQTDVGADITLFKKRLNVTLDYFWKSTFNLIKPQDTGWTQSTGVGAPLINQGTINNEGFEFSAKWTQKIGEVEIDLGGNFATLKNRVAFISSDPTVTYNFGDNYRTGVLIPFRSAVGTPYYSYWLIKTDGIFKSNQEAAAYVDKNGNRIQPNAVAGDLKFVDKNGDGVIDANDRQYMGSYNPTLTYGFSLGARWKNWDVNAFFQGVGGVKIFNAWKETTLNAATPGYNHWNKILDAWSPTNVNSTIPRLTVNDTNQNFTTNSDYYLESGDYLRLKNLQIGYTLDKKILGSQIRLYVSGENLLTFTKYSGMDPEVSNHGLDAGTYPVSRTLSLGAKVSF